MHINAELFLSLMSCSESRYDYNYDTDSTKKAYQYQNRPFRLCSLRHQQNQGEITANHGDLEINSHRSSGPYSRLVSSPHL
jgi:hypothetical protein